MNKGKQREGMIGEMAEEEEEAEERWRGKRVQQQQHHHLVALELDNSYKKNKNHQRSSSSSNSIPPTFRPSADKFLLNTYSFGGGPSYKVSSSSRRCINRRRGSMMFRKQCMKSGEPRSPEVSCFGRVLDHTNEHTTNNNKNKSMWWWTCGIGGLAHCCGASRGIYYKAPEMKMKMKMKMKSPSPTVPTPSDLASFKSGRRRSVSWDGASVDFQTKSNSKQQQLAAGEIWRRRSLGQLHPLDIATRNCTLSDSDDSDDVGPSSL